MTGYQLFKGKLRCFNDIPAFIPTRTREIMIISKDLAALLVKARSPPVMRKTLFSNRHFFLGRRERSGN